MNSAKINRLSLPDEVARKLQEQISLGKWEPGERLPTEPELMSYFGVSRSTIREAVRILSNTGWIRVQQGAGTFVETNKPQQESLSQRLQRVNTQDLEEVRLMLEHKIAGKAALNRTEEDIERMTFFLSERRKYAEQNQPKACIAADIQFHTRIAQASGNSILADLYQAFATQLTSSFLEKFRTTDPFKATQLLHEQLLTSIIEQNAEAAWYWADKIVSH
ncbi:FadR/GntR family transcriptional regulator [Spirosoma endbachense]|uniref:GntR family transcriptional regulator n=1 Tax=Spirosoma endbachense TaxID=2666025 RepID=A0A6P1W7S5_9BACT|nr:FadR/GntR family transcriptional regulator [Spirosoma endbachense]QHW00955.1 GntR family transcriptional regulator [Spirosoma endbachense]